MVGKALLITVLLVVLFTTFSCAPRLNREGAGPSVEIESPVWEFGTIKRGETVTTEITVANSGTDTLSISLYSTCDCLIAETPAHRIAAGERTSVLLTYIGDEVRDRVTKTLYIDTNDTLNPRITIDVTGTILPGELPHMAVIPNPLPVGISAAGESAASLTLTNRGKLPLVIAQIRCFGCVNDWTCGEVRAGEKLTLRIDLLPDWHDKRWLEIESNDPVSPLRKVSIIELE